ncbi:MAG TPA: hypothetical protein VE223_04555 [Nitrososphaeraceae archaeon]|nr:hypothetical protein [Nitrososphaeraceae archaeon]
MVTNSIHITIPNTIRNNREAIQFVKFMLSKEARTILEKLDNYAFDT